MTATRSPACSCISVTTARAWLMVLPTIAGQGRGSAGAAQHRLRPGPAADVRSFRISRVWVGQRAWRSVRVAAADLPARGHRRGAGRRAARYRSAMRRTRSTAAHAPQSGRPPVSMHSKRRTCARHQGPCPGCHPLRPRIGRTRSRPDSQPHHPPPLRYLPVPLEAELLEQVGRAGMEIGAALRARPSTCSG